MKLLNLTKERKARIWLDEIPLMIQTDELHFPVCSEVVDCKGVLHPLRTTIAAELFIPTGGRFFYGLLGIQSFGVEGQQTCIELGNFARHRNSEIRDSLAGTLDVVEPWVNEEYHAAIFLGASTAASRYAMLPRHIRICSARQGLIGSSSVLFRRLAFICVALLATSDGDIEQKVEELVSLPAEETKTEPDFRSM